MQDLRVESPTLVLLISEYIDLAVQDLEHECTVARTTGEVAIERYNLPI